MRHALALSMTARRQFRPPGDSFSPSALFSSGEQGIWFDPSDIDRYMSELGPELVTNGDFSNGATGWMTSGTGAYTVSGGVASKPNTNYGIIYQAIGLVAGRTYQVKFTITTSVSYTNVLLGGTQINGVQPGATNASLTIVGVAGATGFLSFESPAGNSAIDNISVRELTAINTATLFQDTAGTTPVTAVEQPVGLMLDKRLGATNYNPSTMPVAMYEGTGASTISRSGETLVFTSAPANDGIRFAAISIPDTFAEIEFTASGAGQLVVYAGGSPNGFNLTGTPTRYRAVTVPNASPFTIFRAGPGGLSANVIIHRVTGVPGNHATQGTSTAKPVLRARYNLLTYSEDFSNAAWLKAGSPTLTNLGNGVWRLQAAAGSSWLLYQSAARPSAENCKFTIEVKSNGGGSDFRTLQNGSYNTSVTATTEWTRISTTPGPNNGSGNVGIVFDAANSAIDILIRFPDLRQTNLPAGLPAYQRIAAATDYDTVGFPVYLETDGVDDGMATGSINFAATDKMTVIQAIRDMSTSLGVSCELSGVANGSNGSFVVYNRLSANGDIATGLNTGSSFGYRQTSAPASYPRSTVVSSLLRGDTADLSTAISLRVNSAPETLTSSSGAVFPGNFGNYPLYLFSRGGSSLRWKGNFYGLIIRGAVTDDATLAKAEQFLNQKMGGIY